MSWTLKPLPLLGCLLTFVVAGTFSCGGSSNRGNDDVQQDVPSPDAGVPCTLDTDCNDNDPCTADSCGADGFCDFQLTPDVACEDGNLCTTGEKCNADGECKDGVAIELPNEACLQCGCDPATGVFCQAREAGTLCSDGDCCSTGDRCTACAPGDPGCNEYGIQCLGEGDPCDDGNACTSDSCECTDGDPVCGNTQLADGTFCELDPNACNEQDTCQAGQCVQGEPLDLSDDNPCTRDRCVKGEVVHELLNEGQCDDGEPCTTDDHCSLGSCVGGPRVVCDLPPCASSVSCVDGTGCVPVWIPAGTVCDDGDACTQGDQCAEDHTCMPTQTTDPDDGNQCTIDSCDRLTGQVRHTPRVGACDDSDLCTTDDTCTAEGDCVGEVAITCDDVTEQCLQKVCNPGTGLCDLPVPDGTPCANANLCDGLETCQAGVCVAGTSVDCSGQAGTCYQTVCNPTTGLCDLPAANGTVCDDGQPCTTQDQCTAGQCGGIERTCPDDGNPCTSDVCVVATGDCGQPLTDGSEVPDTDLCDGTEICQAGQVVDGDPVACPDDGDACTTDVCDPADGTCGMLAPNGTVCDDDVPCTTNDVCTAGACAGVAVVCPDDGNPCTTDQCVADTGACGVAVADGTLVPDADLCDGAEFCNGGIVMAGDPVVCVDDSNVCTDDVCDPTDGGCGVPFPDGTACSFGFGECQDGDCIIVGYPLPDGFTWEPIGEGPLPEAPAGCGTDFPCNPGQFDFRWVPDTGQMVCYNAAGAEIACPGTAGGSGCGMVAVCGQDAQYGADLLVPLWSDGRFTEAVGPDGNPVVSDNFTGAVYAKTFEYDLTWMEALDYCRGLSGYGGYANWRLADLFELTSIISYGEDLAVLSEFPDLPAEEFWAGSAIGLGAAVTGWRVSFVLGEADVIGGQNELAALCVADLPTLGFPTQRYYRAEPLPGQSLIFDNRTGLIWEGPFNAQGFTWAQAMARCENLVFGTISDWRLPNAFEIFSIVDTSRFMPSTDPEAFPVTLSMAGFWSSTTFTADTVMAVEMGLVSSILKGMSKAFLLQVRCVTAGP